MNCCKTCGHPFPTDEELDEFEELCKPLIEYLQTKHNPHTWIILQWNGAWLAKDDFSIPFKVPD